MPGYSYTTGRNFYDRLTNGQGDSTLLSNGDELINQSNEVVMSLEPWSFLELLESVATVDGQRAYEIPANIRDTLDTIYVDDGSTIHLPAQILDSEKWSVILSGDSGESDVPEFWYRRGSQIQLDPIPSANNDTIYFVGRKRFGRLYAADYTTGTVSITAGTKAVTGVGTTFTAAMVGRYIRFDDGDNLLYEIASYTSGTSITLTKPYEGSANVSGSAYNIGQYSPIPFEYQAAPIYRAAAIYWQIQGDSKRADWLWSLYDGGKEVGKREDYGGMIGQLYARYGRKSEGGYIVPKFDLSPRDPNIPPLNIPASNFT